MAGNYDTSFYIASAGFILASIFGFLGQFLQRIKSRTIDKSHNTNLHGQENSCMSGDIACERIENVT